MKVECLIRASKTDQHVMLQQMGFSLIKAGRRKAFTATLEQVLDLTVRQKIDPALDGLDIQCMLEAETPTEEAKMRKLGANSLEVDGKFGIFCDPCDVASFMKYKTPVNKYVVAKKSTVHGTGAFAKVNLKEGQRIIEYTGQRMLFDKALENMPHDPKEPNHTFIFTLSGDMVIDAFYGGNASMWINHSCSPNLVAEIGKDDRVWLIAAKDIAKGTELSFDYCLQWQGRVTAAIRKDYECRCGSPNCRGTMLEIKTKRKAV